MMASRRYAPHVALGVSLISLAVPHPNSAQGQCPREWASGFEVPGVVGNIETMVVWDDGSGSGPALYVGGELSLACDVPVRNIAKWDGTRWHDVGGGTNYAVHALAVWDDGTGPALYVGGEFYQVGAGQPIKALAKWDGMDWSAVGEITDVWPVVWALGVWDDSLGAGPALYAGGEFDIDGLGSPCIAKWNGAKWSGLGTGMTGWFGESPAVYALAVYDAGDGPKLYAGGFYHKAGGVAAANIALWDGLKWSALVEPGVWGDYHPVRTMLAWDNGTGPSVFVGGDLRQAGGILTSGIARYDGQSWYDVGGGLDDNAEIYALAAFDDGRGPALYVGGDLGFDYPVSGIIRWDGRSWNQVGPGVFWFAGALAVYDPPGAAGPGLYIGGPVTAGDHGVQGITRWDGQAFSNLGYGEGGAGDGIDAMITWDDGGGPSLYVGGDFLAIGSTAAAGIARWNGKRWDQMTQNLHPSYTEPQAFAIFDDTSGTSLYAAGRFYDPNTRIFSRLIRWDGGEQGWRRLDSSQDNGLGWDMAVWDDGNGLALYVCGNFTEVDGVPANYIARWDGSTWSPLGAGLEGQAATTLEVFDDGRGPALYVGGWFTKAGEVVARNLARWDGKAWSDVGGGINRFPYVLLTVDTPGGKLLVAGGTFTEAGNIAVRGCAAWDGHVWRDMSTGLNREQGQPVGVYAICEFDNGSGPAIYATGPFTEPALCFARWDGRRWTAVAAGGVFAQALAPSSIQGPSLFAGGSSLAAGERASVRIAQWRCVSGWKPGDTNCDGAVNFADINPFVLALLDKSRYEAEFPNCLWVNADCNGDDAVNFADINSFVALLKR